MNRKCTIVPTHCETSSHKIFRLVIIMILQLLKWISTNKDQVMTFLCYLLLFDVQHKLLIRLGCKSG